MAVRRLQTRLGAHDAIRVNNLPARPTNKVMMIVINTQFIKT
jgi:hypothetical protein